MLKISRRKLHYQTGFNLILFPYKIGRIGLVVRVGGHGAQLSSDTVHKLNGFRKSTPPLNRQLIIYYEFTVQ